MTTHVLYSAELNIVTLPISTLSIYKAAVCFKLVFWTYNVVLFGIQIKFSSLCEHFEEDCLLNTTPVLSHTFL